MFELPTITVERMRLSQLSGLAWDDDEGLLYAISDKGWLFQLKPRFEKSELVGITLNSAVALQKPPSEKKRNAQLDVEGLDIVNARNGRKGDAELLVSFERTPRIVRYRPNGETLGELTLPDALTHVSAYKNPNLMLESVCVDAALGVLTAPEEPLADETPGNNRIFSLKGKTWRYRSTDNSPLSAMECLGNGAVLLLERDFGHLIADNRITLSLLSLPANPSADAIVPTPIATLSAAAGHQIDNFEGLTRYKDNRFFMVSDNNDLFVQRTLLMFFEVLDK
jgi:hypothetical protein